MAKPKATPHVHLVSRCLQGSMLSCLCIGLEQSNLLLLFALGKHRMMDLSAVACKPSSAH